MFGIEVLRLDITKTLKLDTINYQILFHNTQLIRYTTRLVGAIIIVQVAGVQY